jgi:AcrR family transcriptional regulator
MVIFNKTVQPVEHVATTNLYSRMPPRTGAISIDALLDAAERVVVGIDRAAQERLAQRPATDGQPGPFEASPGIGGLTLDAVALEAGVSKGGLLHHFPSKDKLLEAMVQRIIDRWVADWQTEIEKTPPGPGRVPRAFLNMCLLRQDEWTDDLRQTSAVLIAALTGNPRLVHPLHIAQAKLDALIEQDGLPQGVGETILAAIDGLWFSWIFNPSRVTPKLLTQVRSVLLKAVEHAEHLAAQTPAHSTPASLPASGDRP